MLKYAIYRIHTERINLTEAIVIEECKNMLASFSILFGIGVYKGIEEESMVIEAMLEHTLHNTGLMRCLAESIKHINAQDAVLFTISPLFTEEI